ncbi:MAG TPA: hypothetical protein VFH31_10990 [Pyrinomonadaceae bacterium]|nr:hypothetical protein [Pyrinomonadaceae bacterium]
MKVRPFIKWVAIVAMVLLLGVLLGLPAYETRALIIRHEEVRIQSGDGALHELTTTSR